MNECEFDVETSIVIGLPCFVELAAHKRAKLTQAEIAERMGTKTSATMRLESPLYKGKSCTVFNTLRKYAHAVECKMQIKCVKQGPAA